MARIRRTRFLAFTCDDSLFLDIPALLRGEARLSPIRNTYALSVLCGERYPIAAEELEFLLSVPSDRWVETDGADGRLVDRLARGGLLLTDAEDEPLAVIARRDRELEAGAWSVYGALYHFLTKWRDVDFGEVPPETEAGELSPEWVEAIDRFVGEHGAPPPAFHALDRPRAVHELPVVEREHGLYEALANRKTTRGFDRDARMTVDELATVLYYAFGCHGYAPMARTDLMIKRTSPSAGGLHPIEVYPLVAGVEGIARGVYHYNTRDHALELITELDAAAAHELATTFVCGQQYFASAHVLFVMTARFYRSFWKYRRHERGYAVLMMDAAHLSQTVYLVAAELGLGAFVTAAVNGANIEDALGLDGWAEGALAVSGCGIPAARRSPLEPRFSPYVPRETPVPPRSS